MLNILNRITSRNELIGLTGTVHLNWTLCRLRREGWQEGKREDLADRDMDDSLELDGFRK